MWETNPHLHELYIHWIMDRFNIDTYQQFYDIKYSYLVNSGGQGFLAYYGNSLYEALCSIIPNVTIHNSIFYHKTNIVSMATLEI
jgi:hypothetical protein